ncbi:MAG: glycosyltransferase family 2 protein [Solirubrobacteraceae bacterium]|nr:glycosyltransferase family 2 protein [Solirubrobacteraceae bacterium]
MTDRPLVSVLMPVHRDSEMLRAAARSVLDQGVDDLELIISDDSGGGLRDAAAALGDERVKYFANDRQLGLAGNHTIALERASGELLAFLHDDDEWLPGYLPRAVELFAGDPELGIVCSDVWIDRGGAWERRRRPAPGRYADWIPVLMDHNTFIPSATVMRREVWEAHEREMPDLPVGDVVMFIEAAKSGWALRWVDEPLVRYRMHPGNAGAKEEARFRDALVQIFDSYRFDDPVHEAARRARVAQQLIARGGLSLRDGDPDGARADLARAREIDPARKRARRVALGVMLDHPQLRDAARRARDLFPRI